MTNYEKTKALSPEELAKLLCEMADCDTCPGRFTCVPGRARANGLIDYLGKEVKTDGKEEN